MDPLRRVMTHRASHVVFAFVVLGGWAYWANRAHPLPAPLIAGLVQGVISASITVALQWVIHAVYTRSRNAWFSMICAALFSLATITGLHTLAGTPEIATTIALPWLVGCSYIVLYTLGLHRQARA